jgi:hypothetical protein
MANYLHRKSASAPGQKSANFKMDFASRGEACLRKNLRGERLYHFSRIFLESERKTTELQGIRGYSWSRQSLFRGYEAYDRTDLTQRILNNPRSKVLC